MKKFVAVIIAALLFCGPVYAGNEAFQFRGGEWGLPMLSLIPKVVDYEMEKDDSFGTDDYEVEMDRFIVYDRKVGGHKCEVDYFLVGSQFADGAYIFREEHSNIEQYYADYKDLLEKYIDKYGDPDVDEKKWIGDSIYKDKPEKYGMAIGLGELQLHTQWEADDGSIIQFRAAGDNFDIIIRIDYLCPGYYDLKENAKTDEDDGI